MFITLKPWVLNRRCYIENELFIYYILKLLVKRSILLFCIPEHAMVLCALLIHVTRVGHSQTRWKNERWDSFFNLLLLLSSAVHSFEAKTFPIDPIQALWKWLISILAKSLWKFKYVICCEHNNDKSAELNVVNKWEALGVFLSWTQTMDLVQV